MSEALFRVGNGAGFSGDRVDAPGPVADTLVARGGPAALFFEVLGGRAGDKGNRLNVSLFPYDPALYPLLAEQVTAERVHELFRRRGATGVKRYELPLLAAFNFVIDDVLEGGVNGSLNLDGHGKTHSFRLLTLPVRVPARFVRHAGLKID